MKTYIILFSLFLLTAATFSSCQSSRVRVPGSPIFTQVNLTMDDLEYVGEISGTTRQSYLLGFIPVGGRRFHHANIAIGSTNLNIQNRGFRNALYDALQTVPDADFVLPLTIHTTIDRMFLGRKETVKLRAKAFRIKTHVAATEEEGQEEEEENNND